MQRPTSSTWRSLRASAVLIAYAAAAGALAAWVGESELTRLGAYAALLVLGIVGFAHASARRDWFRPVGIRDSSGRAFRALCLVLPPFLCAAYAAQLRAKGMVLTPAWNAGGLAGAVNTLLVLMLIPVAEEVFFRGLVLDRMQGLISRSSWLVFANATWFAALHPAQSIPPAFVVGSASAVLALRTGDVRLSVVVHILSMAALDLGAFAP